jgi:hypothetical protein
MAMLGLVFGCSKPADALPEKTTLKLVLQNSDGSPFTDKPGEKSKLRIYVDGGAGSFSDLPMVSPGVYARTEAAIPVGKYWATLVIIPASGKEVYRPLKDQPFDLTTDLQEVTFQLQDAKAK